MAEKLRVEKYFPSRFAECCNQLRSTPYVKLIEYSSVHILKSLQEPNNQDWAAKTAGSLPHKPPLRSCCQSRRADRWLAQTQTRYAADEPAAGRQLGAPRMQST